MPALCRVLMFDCNVETVHSAVESLQRCFADVLVALNNHELVINADNTQFPRASNINSDLIFSTKKDTNNE